jgi:hypothetical protein
MSAELISADEFKERLVQLCLGSRSAMLPRRQRDRQIILKSVALCFQEARTYTEQQVNDVLINWMDTIGSVFETDHAALRRYLIDERYLDRSDTGESYRLSRPHSAGLFAADVEEVRPELVLIEAGSAANAKKALYQRRLAD